MRIYLILYVFLSIHPVRQGATTDCHPELVSGSHSLYNSQSASDSVRRRAVYMVSDPQLASNPLSASDSDFEGVKRVYVSLVPQSFAAKMMALVAKPEGEAYVKLTAMEGGVVRIQFCDAQGEVRVSASNGTGFCAGAMPKRLYLTDVKFRYEGGKISDAQNGHNTVTVLPCADCSGKDQQWTQAQVREKTKTSDTAVILPKAYSGVFQIEIKLNLSVAFNAVIKEIKE